MSLLPSAQSSTVLFRRLQGLWTGRQDGADIASYPISETVPFLDMMSFSGSQSYLLMDMLTQQYLYASPNQQHMSGVSCDDLYKGGLAFVFERIHPDDRAPLLAMFEAKWAFFNMLTPQEQLAFRGNYDYRLKNANGQYRRVQQQSLCLSATTQGLPHIILAQLVDITHLKPIEPEPGTNKSNLLLTVNTGGPDRLVLRILADRIEERKKPLLSPREVEVLKLLEVGLNTHAIAQRLGSQPATVTTQRRQMTAKTGVVDTTALVSYARLLGWL